MKPIWFLSGLGFLSFILAGCAASATSPQGNALQQPQRWEYKVVKMEEGTEKNLGALMGELGALGWEYAGQVTGKEEQLIFKRPAGLSPVRSMTATTTISGPFPPPPPPPPAGPAPSRRIPVTPPKPGPIPETQPDVTNHD